MRASEQPTLNPPAAAEDTAPPAPPILDSLELAPPSDYPFLAPPQDPDELGRLGPYRVLKVLGTGAMGVVFHAEDPNLRRLVALKVMRPSLAASAEFHRRFLREARLAAAIDHEHIVTVYHKRVKTFEGSLVANVAVFNSFSYLLSFPIQEFGDRKDTCKACGKAQTEFGQPFWSKRYFDHPINWMQTI